MDAHSSHGPTARMGSGGCPPQRSRISRTTSTPPMATSVLAASTCEACTRATLTVDGQGAAATASSSAPIRNRPGMGLRRLFELCGDDGRDLARSLDRGIVARALEHA